MSRLAELAFTSDHQPGGKGSRMSASGSGVVVPGMGHDLPRPVWPALADAITALADRAGHPR